MAKIDEQQADFNALRDSKEGQNRILKLLKQAEKRKYYLSDWLAFSKKSEDVYPSQGLLQTPHDYLEYREIQMLSQEKIIETLRMRRFFLELFNHPYRISFLDKVNKSNFSPPKKIKSKVMEYSDSIGMAISVGDLGAKVVGSTTPRISRKERYAQGPFIKLGRQARTLFVGSASPDVWNSAAAIATMAASHCLSAIPRNGVTSDIKRQADLASEVFVWLDRMANEVLGARDDKEKILTYWKNNVVGTLSAKPSSVIEHASLLYERGVRVFRIYSPEPGTEPIETLKVLRKQWKDKIEIFVSHIVDVEQAKLAQKYGADAIYVGIGGGGRCITAVRSGSVVDWPSLVWNLRGEIDIPVIVEGGASDHVATSLLLGASGIGVSRVVSGGTIESPGGALFFVDTQGNYFKPYGGEASARTKYLDQKLLPFNVPSFVEGETTKAHMHYYKHVMPTLTYNLHILIEDAILAMVFRNVETISELTNISPSPLRLNTHQGSFQQGTH